jgi:hypothetical protein
VELHLPVAPETVTPRDGGLKVRPPGPAVGLGVCSRF